jgi:hypothetical protein
MPTKTRDPWRYLNDRQRCAERLRELRAIQRQFRRVRKMATLAGERESLAASEFNLVWKRLAERVEWLRARATQSAVRRTA